MGRLEEDPEFAPEVERQRPPLQTLDPPLIAPAGLRHDPLDEANLLEHPDRAANPCFAESVFEKL